MEIIPPRRQVVVYFVYVILWLKFFFPVVKENVQFIENKSNTCPMRLCYNKTNEIIICKDVCDFVYNLYILQVNVLDNFLYYYFLYRHMAMRRPWSQKLEEKKTPANIFHKKIQN